jgi:ATP-dependent Lon protease
MARRILEGGASGTIDRTLVGEMLGPERFFPEEARRELPAGVAAGLAWTESGGDALYVEAALVPKDDKVTLTGHLGDVMKESALAARSWLWSVANRLALDAQRIADNGVHVHVPAGAVPKDGPSAGVTMACALASIYSGKPVRADVAMTGEMTLSGLVLPVGGVKEKVLAAHRAGLKTVLLPNQNRHDLEKLPEQVREEMSFVLVERIEEVLEAAIPGLMVAPVASVS